MCCIDKVWIESQPIVESGEAELHVAEKGTRKSVRERIEIALVQIGVTNIVLRVRAIKIRTHELIQVLTACPEKHLGPVAWVVIDSTSQPVCILRSITAGVKRCCEVHGVKDWSRIGNRRRAVYVINRVAGCLELSRGRDLTGGRVRACTKCF